MKLVSFILVLTVVLLEAKLNLWKNVFTFSSKTIINYLFTKDPRVIRVRDPNEIETQLKYVTTLDFIGLVERYGYFAEEHYVTTEDGYNLVIHRILRSPLFNNQQRRKVVFLQHGILCSSDCWVATGTGKDLPLLLADQGYDVWLGNNRGNTYCRSHVKLSLRSKDFWQFSYHEMATRDLPAMIDYVLDYTKQKTLRYIGHSMGTTELFVLLSMKPEYNAKIKLGILLAPIAIWKQMPPLLEPFVSAVPKIEKFLDFNEIYELGTLSSTTITIGRTLCSDKAPITQAVCAEIIFLAAGYDPAQLNNTSLPEKLSNYPAGTSVQTLIHYYQNVISQKFQSYDYGYFGNYKQYGQIIPITYDLKQVTVPLALFYSANDLIALKSNVLELRKSLPNVVLLEKNSFELFNHLDFIWAMDAKTLIYDRVSDVLQTFDTPPSTIDELAYI